MLSARTPLLLFPFVPLRGENKGIFFQTLLFWAMSLILIRGHTGGTVVSFNTTYKVIIGFSLPNCREKNGLFLLL